MGTNYYLHLPKCAHCNHNGSVHHIGKSSTGWPFHFRAYREGEVATFAVIDIEAVE